MKQLKYILLLSFTAIALASCVTARRVNYMQEPDKHIPQYADTLHFEDYQLRPGDRLLIYVYSLDERITKMYNAGGGNSWQLRGMGGGNMGNGYGGYGGYDLYTYKVDDDGNITYPTLGKIQVKGMTTREVKKELERELSTLLQDIPGFSTVSVEVNTVQRSFSIIGTQSGRYSIYKEKMTIFEALAMAGDIAEFADRSQIKLIRERNGKTEIKTFDVRSKDIVNSEYYYIESNDILYIRDIDGKSFGINSAGTTVGVVASTLSFGVFIYTIVQTGINHVQKYYPEGNK